MESVTYFVPNISCAHCAHTIKMELINLEGISSVAVDVDKKEVSISYSHPLSLEKIESTLAEINYPVEKQV